MADGFTTVGEAFAGREFRKESRAGTEHYAIGQHHAISVEREGADVAAVLGYISPLGLTVVPMVKPEFGEDDEHGEPTPGDWEPLIRQARVLGLSVDYGVKPLPDDWELTEAMRKVLDEAADRG